MAKPRILVVDDDPYSVRDVFDTVADAGFDVEFSGLSEDVVLLLRQSHFDIVVVDIMMNPEGRYSSFESRGGFITGHLLAREIRDALPEQKIVALSLSRDAGIEEWFNNQDGMVFVRKGTVTPQDFVKLLGKVFNNTEENWGVSGSELLDSIQLKPSIFGIGIDLKKAIRSIKKK